METDSLTKFPSGMVVRAPRGPIKPPIRFALGIDGVPMPKDCFAVHNNSVNNLSKGIAGRVLARLTEGGDMVFPTTPLNIYKPLHAAATKLMRPVQYPVKLSYDGVIATYKDRRRINRQIGRAHV